MLKLISHRGTINGKHETFENFPTSIDTAIDNGFDFENGDALFTKWSNVKNQCDVKSLHKSDLDLELEMELG